MPHLLETGLVATCQLPKYSEILWMFSRRSSLLSSSSCTSLLSLPWPFRPFWKLLECALVSWYHRNIGSGWIWKDLEWSGSSLSDQLLQKEKQPDARSKLHPLWVWDYSMNSTAMYSPLCKLQGWERTRSPSNLCGSLWSWSYDGYLSDLSATHFLGAERTLSGRRNAMAIHGGVPSCFIFAFGQGWEGSAQSRQVKSLAEWWDDRDNIIG